MKLKELKKGDFFKRTATAKAVYIRGEYDRSLKKFECTDTEDINRFIFISGEKEVFTEFEY